MTNKNNENKYKITERVFADGSKPITKLLNSYLESKVDNIISKSYDDNETKAISKTEREVA